MGAHGSVRLRGGVGIARPGTLALFMVRDDTDGLDVLTVRVPLVATANPFDAVRERRET
jgi:hypothetical protein